MKIRLTTLALLIGASMILVPIVFDLKINRWVYYVIAVVGGLLCAIAGHGAQANMLGMGNTGEALLQRLWIRLKNKLQGKPTAPEDPLGWRKAKKSYEPENSPDMTPDKDSSS
jgi:hypothetical protein